MGFHDEVQETDFRIDELKSVVQAGCAGRIVGVGFAVAALRTTGKIRKQGQTF